MSDTEKALKDLQSAWDQFKEANDANQKKRDTVLDDKINRIEKQVLDKLEPLNQQMTQAQVASDAIQRQLDHIETVMNRPGSTDAANADTKKGREVFDRLMRKPATERTREDLDDHMKRVATLIKGDDSGAGYLVAPADLQAEIIKDVIEQTPMRALARVVNIGRESLKQPKRTGTASATRVGEGPAQRSNTGDPSYGMIELRAPELFARFEVSQQMLEDSGYDILAELRSETGEQFSVKEGIEYVGGNGGDLQAQGFLVAGGVDSVNSGHASQLTGDGYISLYTELKTVYARNAVFTLNRKTLGATRKLKDGQGNYLWMPGLLNGVPNSILGTPYAEMSDMPDVGAGAFPVALADWRRAYTIVDRIAIAFQVDFITGADNGVVVFRGRKRTGGGVVLPQAIKKMVIAA